MLTLNKIYFTAGNYVLIISCLKKKTKITLKESEVSNEVDRNSKAKS